MAIRTLLIIGIFAIGFSTRAWAQLSDEAAEKKRAQDDVNDSVESIDRAAHGFAAANTRVRPKAIPDTTTLTECYVCTDCPSIQLNSTSRQCPYGGDSSKQNKCILYAEKYKHMNKPWYIRGCVSERGSCADVKAAHESHSDIVELVSCHECEGDKCNGVSRSVPTVTAFLVLVVIPLIAKHTLS